MSDCPEYFTEEQLAKYQEIELLLGDEDFNVDLLSAYVVEWSRWQDAERKLASVGVIVGRETAAGTVPIISLYVQVARDARREALKLRCELGI